MSQILYEEHDGIAYITLNRQEKLNALTPQMVVELARHWMQIEQNKSVRVALITGAGVRAFSTGGDLGSLIPILMKSRPPGNEWEQAIIDDQQLLSTALLRNATFFKPVVAAVNGLALAGGMEMLLGTDIRIASENATFALTEVRRGIIAGGGSLARISRQLAWADAMELVLVGEPISAAHALRIGLVNRVVPLTELLSEAQKFAKAISKGAPIALAKSKEAIVRSSGATLVEAFGIESECVKDIAGTHDAVEGPLAFMERRKPEFLGR